ncbi:hypothetical protein [Bacteroides sp. 51]|uniref:S24 family peptidase n=1 Tax=Bacteroides sp. 51 TaxID=2302938 RepID=UPI0013CF507D|nr:hypothetical protein [Bacteroides sp. 51]NDV84273.1 hypothetical protein [Bacteroides sp. 51]
MEERKERLLKAYEYLRSKGVVHTQNDVAERVGSNRVNVSNAFRGQPKYLTDRFLRRFNAAFGEIFNLTWLVDGEGEMLKAGVDRNMENNVVGINFPKKAGELYLETKNGMKYYEISPGKYKVTVPLVPYNAYARFANDCELQLDREEWETADFEVDQIGHGNYMAFEVRGDSMDDGTKHGISQGETLLVRELDRIHWMSGLRYKKFPFWVVAFDNSILIKEITDHNIETGDITCHSLNPSPEYRDFTINLDDIQRLFNVIKIKPLERDF